MYLSRIIVENYKLLEHVDIKVDKNTTIIVGKNNVGKTSLFEIMNKFLNEGALSISDYPLKNRNDLYDNIKNLILKKYSFDNFIEKLKLTKITVYVNYEDKKANDFLGYLSPFIIDLNEDVFNAIINATYEFNLTEDQLLNFYEEQIKMLDSNGAIDERLSEKFENGIREVTKKNFNSFFKIQYYAINPNDINDRVNKVIKEVQDLFPNQFIKAERGLDENEYYLNNKDPFEKILSQVFKDDILDAENVFGNNVIKLRDAIDSANKSINSKIKNKMNKLIEKSMQFGYPSTDELKFSAETNVDISSNLASSTKLYYKSQDEVESLPSMNNGLGYKNLIKIELYLSQFANEISKKAKISIPLLFIEEPESHMHPQLQRKFVEYLNDFLKQISCKTIQIFVTTHSSYIINSVDLKNVRYALKNHSSVKYKDLNDYINKNMADYKFIKKFLKIEVCDIFFADKLILVEGTCERLLIPQIISNLVMQKKFSNDKYNLSNQYYSLIEVGGTYAYKFISLINFLQVYTLIITDIDSAVRKKIKNKISYCKELYSKSMYSTNATIKNWYECKNSYMKLDDLKTDSDKTKRYCHLEYQEVENGLCGRSLEESIINVNRKYYKLPDKINDEQLTKVLNNKSKTDFAIDLLINNSNFVCPSYIEKGLIWLDNSPVGGING